MKNKKWLKIVIFTVVLLIPIIYSFFYLKAYWNPYGNLQDMKVAIVNLDQGNGQTNEGEKISKGLKEKNVVDICEVTEQEAKEGLDNQKYYAVITIPENFTNDLNSAGEVDKKVVNITYTPNQKMNYLASQIINKVVTATEAEIKSNISTKVVDNLTQSIQTVPESLQKISDGSGKIVDGSESLSTGLAQLNNGATKLDNSYTQFNNGIQTASEGSKKLTSGIEQVNSGMNNVAQGGNKLNLALKEINEGANTLSASGNEGIAKLGTGIATLNQGAQKLNQGANQYVDSTNKLGTNVIGYIDGVNKLNTNSEAVLKALAQYGTVSTDPNVIELAKSAQQILDANSYNTINQNGTVLQDKTNELMKSGNTLTNKTKELSSGTTELQKSAVGLAKITGGISSLQQGLAKVEIGTEDLNNGVSKLEVGTQSVKSGSENLENGLSILSENSNTIKSGISTLSQGTQSAYNGSIELKNGTQTLKQGVDEGIITANGQMEKLNGLSNHVAKPVQVIEKDYGEVDSYGIAFTPLFLSIGLWVGALMCYVVLYYDQKNRFGILDSKYKNKILQNVVYLVIGVAQGIITAFLLKIGLNFNVENVFAYYVISALAGLCFTSIIQFLIRTFGDVGKFLALIVLVLQLAAAGGTFPIDIVDKGFRWLNPLLPMTYTIKLIKDCLISTDSNFITHNVMIIILYIVGFSTCTFIIETIKTKTKKNN